MGDKRIAPEDQATPTPRQAAERRGSEAAFRAVEAMRAMPMQAERLRRLRAAILDATEGPHRRRAAGGFSVALIAYLDYALGIDV
jgi:hypothetical protein